jgi:hypothetical protein
MVFSCVFFLGRSTRAPPSRGAVHLFFFGDGRTRRRKRRRGPPVFFCDWRATRALRRYHVGAAGVAPHDDEKGDGADATPPALQSSGAAANVADDTRCAPVL